MTTSGSATFNLDIADIIEEAFDLAGLEIRAGYQFRTAKRSLNLLTIDWANRGLNLWTVTQATIPLLIGQASYNLPTDTIDLLDPVISLLNQVPIGPTDYTITRIAVTDYYNIPNKTSPGRPTQVWVDRQRDNPTVYLWPVPDQNDLYLFKYTYLRRIQDAGTANTNTMDVPFRFLPALTTGLAYYVAVKTPSAQAKVPMLKQMYDEAWQNAQDEDRDKASQFFVPMIDFSC